MTAGCPGGGASQTKPGVNPLIAATGGGIAALFSKVSIPWAVAAGAGLAAITVDLSQLCPYDPPSDPGITATDWLNVQNPIDVVNYAGSAAKFYQLFKRWLWFQSCECATAPNIVIPTPPAAPANLPVINPWGGGTPASLCWEASATTHPVPPYPYIRFLDWLPPEGIWAPGAGGDRDITAPRWQRVVWENTWNTDGTHFTTGLAGIGWYDSGGVLVRQDSTPHVAMSTLSTLDVTPPSNAITALFYLGGYNPLVGPDASATASVKTHLRIACTGQSIDGAATPCCPPDPVLTGQLNQILGLVTLMQRQLAPFAYVTGAAHAGLTGSGHFAVQGLLGAKVALTTLPGALGQSGTLPVEIFDAGWITWNTPDGYPQSIRIEHNPQLSLPARCSLFTDLAYDLHPGVVATITELAREP